MTIKEKIIDAVMSGPKSMPHLIAITGCKADDVWCMVDGGFLYLDEYRKFARNNSLAMQKYLADQKKWIEERDK